MTLFQRKSQALQDAVDSFALEFLSPTQENLEQMSAWLAGEINDKQLMESAYEIWERTISLS